MCDAVEKYCDYKCCTQSQSSEQHVDMRDSKEKRDQDDLQRFCEWLERHSSFAPRTQSHLVSLSTGLVGNDQVNCDQAFVIGLAAMRKLNGLKLTEVLNYVRKIR
jgi:hypothetical protein